MAKFRNVSVKFWSDPFVETLTPEKRYFFLYLITNEHTTQCGIYEISFRSMAFETGYNTETIEKLVQFFEKAGKIKYSKKTNELAIKNFVKHNPQGSPKVKAFVDKEIKNIKDQSLIAYIYAIDTLSQEEEEQTQEEEQEEEREEEQEGGVIVWPSFLDFWDKYEKKQDRPKCEKKWEKINQEAREKIMLHLEDYILSTPDKQYRKNPLTYLNSESWENEIITPNTNGKFTREEKVNSLRAAFAKQVIERGKGT
jgi:hypothetical protein